MPNSYSKFIYVVFDLTKNYNQTIQGTVMQKKVKGKVLMTTEVRKSIKGRQET